MSIAAIFSSGSRSTQAAPGTSNGGIAGSSTDPFGVNITTANIAQTQCPVAVAGVLNNFYFGVDTNARVSTNTVANVVNNGSNTAITVTVGPGLTGVFSDTSNTASIAQNDLISMAVTTSVETAAVNLSHHGINFTPNSGNTAFSFSSTSAGTPASGTGPLTTYQGFASNSAVNATIGNAQISTPVSGLMQYLYSYVLTNNRTTTSTHKLNINGSAGTQVLSYTAGTTGLIKDTTHTDSVSAGDLLCSQIDLGTGTGSLTMTGLGSWCVATTDGQSAVGVINTAGNAVAAGATIRNVIAGRLNGSANESQTQGSIPACTTSKLWVHVSANASTTNATTSFRKNATNGNQAVTITASTTGAFQDTTNNDTVATTDLIDYQTSGATTGSVTLNALSMLFTTSGGIISSTKTLAALGVG